MKFSIFCCLLTLCAFDMVRALTKDVQLYDLEDEITDDVYQLVTSKQKDFKVALKAAKQENKDTVACEDHFMNQISDFVVDSVPQYQKCVNEYGLKINNLKSALECTRKFYKSAGILLDSHVSQAKACFNECRPLGKPKEKPEEKHEGKPEGKHRGKPEGNPEGKSDGKPERMPEIQ